MRRFFRMTWWAINAYCYGRNKPHGVEYARKTAAIIALQGFHIGMCWTGAWTDPTYWLLRKRCSRLTKEKHIGRA